MSDRIFALVWIGVCAVIIVQMMVLTVPFAYEPVGPKVFPVLLAVLMTVCCLALLLRPDGDIQWPVASSLGRGIVLLGVLLAYAFGFESLGFPIATAVMVFVVSLLFGGRWWVALITAVAVGLGGFVVFDQVLEVSLPSGMPATGF